MADFLNMQEKSCTSRENWNLIIYVIVQVSIFSWHSAQPILKYLFSFWVKFPAHLQLLLQVSAELLEFMNHGI